MWVSLNKRLVCTVYPNFFSVNMIFSAVQTLGYNKIFMGFNPRGGARGPLSAPRLYRLTCFLSTAEVRNWSKLAIGLSSIHNLNVTSNKAKCKIHIVP